MFPLFTDDIAYLITEVEKKKELETRDASGMISCEVNHHISDKSFPFYYILCIVYVIYQTLEQV